MSHDLRQVADNFAPRNNKTLTIKPIIDMKTYIEISQPSASNLLSPRMENLQSSIQSSCGKMKSVSRKRWLILFGLLLLFVALHLECNLFSLIVIALFFIFLGVLINEFIQYLRFIREMKSSKTNRRLISKTEYWQD